MPREALNPGQKHMDELMTRSEGRSYLQWIGKDCFVWERLCAGMTLLTLVITALYTLEPFFIFLRKAHVLHIMHIH